MPFDLSTSATRLVVGGIGALLGSLALTPIVIRLAQTWGWVDHPSEDRWSNRPVALMGGIAIAGAVALGVAAGGGGAYGGAVWVGAGLMFAVGLTDDLWRVRPDVKVLAQVGATVLLLYAGYAFWRGGPAWASMPLTFLWVIGVTNALNLIDGIDGLAAGVAAVAAGALGLIGVVLGQVGLAVVAAALAGAALGFLVYNAPPASVFMGDCGSLFLGYMLAVGALGIQGRGGPVVGTLVPIAVLAVPIADTTFVSLTRLLRGHPVTEGGTDHVHHRLVQVGLSERRAVAALWGVSAVFGGAALAALWMPSPLVLAVAALSLVSAVVVGTYLGMEGGQVAESGPETPGTTERIGAVMRAFAGGAAWKSVAGVLADLLVVGAAFVVAVHVRYGGAPPPEWTGLMAWVLPGLIGAKLLVFYASGLYEGIWRHAGTPEAVRLVGASTVASLLVGEGLWLGTDLQPAAVSVLLIDWGIATAGVGGVRFGFRALRQYVAAHRDGGRRVLVYGSGEDGMLLLRHLRHHSGLGRTVVGLLDDDPSRHGCHVQGVKVLGGPEDLSRLCQAEDVDEVIIPTQEASAPVRRQVQERCAEAGVDCQYFEARLRPADESAGPVLEPAPGDGAPEEDPRVSSS